LALGPLLAKTDLQQPNLQYLPLILSGSLLSDRLLYRKVHAIVSKLFRIENHVFPIAEVIENLHIDRFHIYTIT
jgi:hypothetical protein